MVATGREGRINFPANRYSSVSVQVLAINEEKNMNGELDRGRGVDSGTGHPELISTLSISSASTSISSFSSLPEKKENSNHKSNDKSNNNNAVRQRRMFEVDGHPLEHWKKENFKPKRDATCRVVYEPKEGKKFFLKTLKNEDYNIMRGLPNTFEQPYLSKYNRFFPQNGHFCCKACGNPLYSHEAKFDVDDGWPAFGASVFGAIGITTATERKTRIKKEDKNCIKIQALVRGNQCRNRFQTIKKEVKTCVKIQALVRGSQCRNRFQIMLDELIEEILRRQERRNSGKDITQTIIEEQEHQPIELFDNSNNFESDEENDGILLQKNGSTGYVLFDELIEEILRRRRRRKSGGGTTQTTIEEEEEEQSIELFDNSKNSESEEKNDKKVRTKNRSIGYVLSRALGENYTEIHCHRCKSHLGDIYVELNTGNRGEFFRERHRVNGRAIKYMHARLPKRIDTRASLFFANQAQRRRLGLPKIVQGATNDQTRPCRPSDILSMTSHDQINYTRSLRPGMIKVGSVSCHERMMTPPNTTRTNFSRRRPMRRGGTISQINIEERKICLSDTLQFSLH
uniref:MsrB domain-containing protein n=1 Tax=Pseudo-nitzschia australis TaxID=44445 RepID=A0A7S4AJM4_9STRA